MVWWTGYCTTSECVTMTTRREEARIRRRGKVAGKRRGGRGVRETVREGERERER